MHERDNCYTQRSQGFGKGLGLRVLVFALGNAQPEKGVGTLGNLLLLEEAANGKIGNKGFAAKRSVYESAATPMDDILKNASKWGATEIASRTKTLAKLAHEKVFKV